MGVLADKEYDKMLDKILPLVEYAHCITPPSPRALDSEELAMECAARGVCSTSYRNLEDGVASAYEYAKTQNVPLVMLGSLYMYGDVVNALEKAKKSSV